MNSLNSKKIIARILFLVFAGVILVFNLHFILIDSSSSAHAGQAVTTTSLINASLDDAEENAATGSMYLTSSDLEFVMDGSVQQVVGMRFTNVQVPKDATILSASITFTVKELQSEVTSLSFFGQAADNPATFTITAGNISSRPRTSARMDWNNIPAWTVLDEKIATPDLGPVIQEIVNRPGWVQNNALTIIVSGSGHRTAASFERSAAKAAVLTISYFTGALEPTSTPTALPTVPAGLVKFAVIGDFGSGNSNELAVANLVKSFSPDFITTVGDNNYPLGEPATIDANIGQFYSNYIYPYTGAFGSTATSNNFYPVPGNHDWNSLTALQPYLDYFSLPNNERYYDFVRGPVHFFMLDWDYREPDGVTSASLQARWLQDGLARSTLPFQFVLLHVAPYSSGVNHGSNLTAQWPYSQWGADAVLSGHEHLYERLEVNNIPYFVNGSGGGGLYPFGVPLPESRVRYNESYGALLVEADPSQVTFHFYNTAMQLIDSCTITAGIGPRPVTDCGSVSDPTVTPTATGPTYTNTPLPSATNTPLPPTYTFTPLPSATNTPLPPTYTNTPLPSATNTPLPQAISIKPLADAYVDKNNPNINYGKTSLDKSDGNPVLISYLKFDLSTLAGKTIISAKLRMRVTDRSNSTQYIRLVPDTSWAETTITYNLRPLPSTLAAAFSAPVKGVSLDVDISQAVAGRVGGLMTLAIDASGSDAFYFYSRENSTFPPSLEIVYR